jgi:hypothetical protein
MPATTLRDPAFAGMDHLRWRIEQAFCAAHLCGPAQLRLGQPADRQGGRYALQAVGDPAGAAAHDVQPPAPSLAVAPDALAARCAALPQAVHDGVAALDLLGHCADVPGALAALGGLLRPGGRLVVDFASLEHVQALQGGALDELLPGAPGQEACLGAAALLQAALATGLQPVLLRPCAAFTGGPETHPLVRSRTVERLYWWQRLLSWVPQDDSLTRLALLIDEQVIARLGPAATGRCLLLLERRDTVDPAAAAACLQPAGLPQGEPLQALAAVLDERLQAGPRELKYFTELRDALRVVLPGVDLNVLVAGSARELLAQAAQRTGLDRLSMDMIRGWRELPEPRALMSFDGVALGDVTDYHMIQMLLIFGFNAFPGIKL